MDLGRRVLFISYRGSPGSGAAPARRAGAAGARRATADGAPGAPPPRRPPPPALRAARADRRGAVSLGAGRRCAGPQRGSRRAVAGPAAVAAGSALARREDGGAHTAYIHGTVRTARKSARHCAMWASRGCHTDTLPRYRYALLYYARRRRRTEITKYKSSHVFGWCLAPKCFV